MKINIGFAIIVMILLMVVVPTILLVVLKKHKKALKVISIIFAIIYFSLLFIGTTFKVGIKGGYVSISPNFNGEWFSMRFLPASFKLRNVCINLGMLFPVGFMVYLFAKNHRFLKTVLLALLISIVIEFYQFVLPIQRTTELADLFFNTISGMISAGYCEMLLKFGLFDKNKNFERKKEG